MNGIDIQGYMARLAGSIDSMTMRGDIEKALDEMEYLYEVMDPELQYLAEDLMQRLRSKLTAL